MNNKLKAQMSKHKTTSKNLKSFNPGKYEKKWEKKWRENRIYQPDLTKASKPFYNLMMFPYPSAEGLHVGNMYAFTGADVNGRFKRMQGYDVFEPIGLDGFGIHSENYAIKIGKHPAEQAKISQKNFYRQLGEIGNSFAWENRLETYNPSYYRWTQWLFIQMFKAGLAYRKKANVNWCPSCKTVLADEQVETGLCERCKNEVEKRQMEQWFFKITKYADRLLENIDGSENSDNSESQKVRKSDESERHNIRLSNSPTHRSSDVPKHRFSEYSEYSGKKKFGPVRKDYDPKQDGLQWPKKIKIAQRNWIGRSEGVQIEFKVQNSKFKVAVFTTAHDTIFGTTFMVIAPEHPIFKKLTIPKQHNNAVIEYIKQSLSKTEQERKVNEREKSGVFTGLYAVNPFTQEEIQLWVADYVLMDYGTGAVMGVPGHDARDHEFALKHELPIKPVIKPVSDSKDEASIGSDGFWDYEEIKTKFSDKSVVFDSDFMDGLSSKKAKKKLEEKIEKEKMGKRVVEYKLRDWCISRQRYWGPPIPMIYCEKCDWQPVPEDQLPVELPFVKDYKPTGDGKSPLENASKDWLEVDCPKCGKTARRETDVSDTFLDSSWYFLRYPSAGTRSEYSDSSENYNVSESQKVRKSEKSDIQTARSSDVLTRRSSEYSEFSESLPWNREVIRRWLPVNAYIGGAEHAVLHLLYARFVAMVLKDLGHFEFEEPFPFLFSHGLIIKDGAKMSKSRGNVVIPDEYIKKYGADTLRCYLMFMGPYDRGGDFRDAGVAGMHRWLKKIWRLVVENSDVVLIEEKDSRDVYRAIHQTIKGVSQDIEHFRYNTAIAKLMEFVNVLNEKVQSYNSKLKTRKIQCAEWRLAIDTLLKLLAPFAPFMTEELWQHVSDADSAYAGSSSVSSSTRLRQSASDVFFSIHTQPWPEYNPQLIKSDEVTIVVQVNGKLRAVLSVNSPSGNTKDKQTSKVKSEIEEKAKKDLKVQKYLSGKKVKKVIFVPGKLINFVV